MGHRVNHPRFPLGILPGKIILPRVEKWVNGWENNDRPWDFFQNHLKPPARKNLPNISQDAESWKIFQDPVPISKLVQLSLGILPGKNWVNVCWRRLPGYKTRLIRTRPKSNKNASPGFPPGENPGRNSYPVFDPVETSAR